MQGADVGMIQRRDRTGFALETLAHFGGVGEMRRQHFDRHRAVQARVACAIDFSHSAGPERSHDLVRPELRSCRKAHEGFFTVSKPSAMTTSLVPAPCPLTMTKLRPSGATS